MGITGLLPFLEKNKVSRPVHIKEFKGCTVAADAYCWLHKGAFACADKLARGEQTDMFLQYCMKYVNMLLANDIKPILVFDGRHLPAKAQTEKKRRERREENRKHAASLLRQGHTTEALSFLRRCIDVTHQMALSVMQECRRRNIDCIVAPYEADAQLAFFSIEGFADVIITEDSDLLLFGCKKVVFKLDLAGNGTLVDQERLYLSMGTRPETYSFDKFRYMCILSGCDYLDSLPGIGLGKACKFITRSQDPDIHKALSRLPSQLNIRGLTVPIEYRDDFMRADAMFKHQLVFDPILRKAKPLTPHNSVHPGSPLAAGPLPGCIPEFDEETSYQLALGNLEPFNLKLVDNYDPKSPNQNQGVKTQSWSQTAVAPHPSIWDPLFKEKVSKEKPANAPSFMPSEGRPVTKFRAVSVDTKDLTKSKKRPREEDSNVWAVKRSSLDVTDSMLTAIYSNPGQVSDPEFSTSCENDSSKFQDGPISPILHSKRSSRNPFATNTKGDDKGDTGNREQPVSLSPPKYSKFSALNKFKRATQRTSTEGKPVVQSRYFANSTSSPVEASMEDKDLLRDVSNTLEDNKEIGVDVTQIYKRNLEDERKGPKIHKKPLFVSTCNLPKDKFEDIENDESESNPPSSDDKMKAMNDNFKKQDLGSVLKISPSKNPFRKVSSPSNQSCEESTDFNDSKQKQTYADKNEEEEVDDPGFESSLSLTPHSHSEDASSLVLSQPDDGFESPSKISAQGKKTPSYINASAGRGTPKSAKSACRISGLKKNPSSGQGQSKLSAFGFIPKPKIQHS